MTKDEFRSRYQLFRKMAGGPVRTYHGMNVRGEGIMVHYLEGSGEENRALLDRLDSLGPEATERIIEIADIEGQPIIVTEFILDFESFVRWVDANGPGGRGAAPAGPAAEPGTSDPSPAAEPAMPLPDATTPPTPAARDAPEATPPSAIGDADPGPGEFTQMFGPEGDAAAREESDGAAAPGEFTLLFRAGSGGEELSAEPTAADKAGPVAEPGAAPGEFTQMFKLGDSESAPLGLGSSDDTDAPPLAGPVADDETGEFTRMFRRAEHGQDAEHLHPPTGHSERPVERLGPWPAGPEPEEEKDWQRRLEGHGDDQPSSPEPVSGASADRDAAADADPPLADASRDDYLERLEASFTPTDLEASEPAMPPGIVDPGHAAAPPAWGDPVGGEPARSEYTEIIAGRQAPPPGPPPPPPAAPSPVPAPTRSSRRKWLPIALGAIIVIALLAIVLAVALSNRQSDEEASPDATPPAEAAGPPAPGAD